MLVLLVACKEAVPIVIGKANKLTCFKYQEAAELTCIYYFNQKVLMKTDVIVEYTRPDGHD